MMKASRLQYSLMTRTATAFNAKGAPPTPMKASRLQYSLMTRPATAFNAKGAPPTPMKASRLQYSLMTRPATAFNTNEALPSPTVDPPFSRNNSTFAVFDLSDTLVFDVITSSMETAARTKNMAHAALPRSEAFNLRLEVQARARNERQRGTIGLRVRHQSASAFGSVRRLSLSYLSERCVRVDSCYTIIHLHVFVKYEVQ
ncbi:hypothetical protein J6590_015711 [Homalodisca vitripennis]|nr:hypothetical protein J6590_015711 [Homalodisca vitripennis]